MMRTIMLQAGEGGWSDPGEYRLVEQQAEGGSDGPPGHQFHHLHLHHLHHHLHRLHCHHHLHHLHQYYFNETWETLAADQAFVWPDRFLNDACTISQYISIYLNISKYLTIYLNDAQHAGPSAEQEPTRTRPGYQRQLLGDRPGQFFDWLQLNPQSSILNPDHFYPTGNPFSNVPQIRPRGKLG